MANTLQTHSFAKPDSLANHALHLFSAKLVGLYKVADEASTGLLAVLCEVHTIHC